MALVGTGRLTGTKSKHTVKHRLAWLKKEIWVYMRVVVKTPKLIKYQVQ